MEDSFTGDPEGCVKEGSGNGSLSLHRGPVLWDIGGDAALLRTERKVRFYFIRRPCLRGIQETCKRMLWKWASPSIGALLGKLDGGLFYWGLNL